MGKPNGPVMIKAKGIRPPVPDRSDHLAENRRRDFFVIKVKHSRNTAHILPGSSCPCCEVLNRNLMNFQFWHGNDFWNRCARGGIRSQRVLMGTNEKSEMSLFKVFSILVKLR